VEDMLGIDSELAYAKAEHRGFEGILPLYRSGSLGIDGFK